jgi:hypothetical protein
MRDRVKCLAPVSLPRTISGETRCARCGYCLRGLSEFGRCPECGGAIAENLFAARGAAHRRRKLRRFAWRTIMVAGFAVVLLGLGDVLTARPRVAPTAPAGAAAPIAVRPESEVKRPYVYSQDEQGRRSVTATFQRGDSTAMIRAHCDTLSVILASRAQDPARFDTIFRLRFPALGTYWLCLDDLASFLDQVGGRAEPRPARTAKRFAE